MGKTVKPIKMIYYYWHVAGLKENIPQIFPQISNIITFNIYVCRGIRCWAGESTRYPR